MKRILIICTVFLLLFAALCASGCYCNCFGCENEHNLGGFCGCVDPSSTSLAEGEDYTVNYDDVTLHIVGEDGDEVKLVFTVAPEKGITIERLEICVLANDNVIGTYFYTTAFNRQHQISLNVSVPYYGGGELSFCINSARGLKAR